MQARLRRLSSDHEQILARYSANPRIKLLQAEGVPPDRYIFAFLVRGLVPTGEDSFAPGEEHKAEFFLPLDYPRRPPVCRMITPVFHPNIDPQKVCIGDHWSAGQSLADLVLRVAEMVAFQSYNCKSPLNAKAAAWAEQNAAQLPLEKSDFSAGQK